MHRFISISIYIYQTCEYHTMRGNTNVRVILLCLKQFVITIVFTLFANNSEQQGLRPHSGHWNSQWPWAISPWPWGDSHDTRGPSGLRANPRPAGMGLGAHFVAVVAVPGLYTHRMSDGSLSSTPGCTSGWHSGTTTAWSLWTSPVGCQRKTNVSDPGD